MMNATASSQGPPERLTNTSQLIAERVAQLELPDHVRLVAVSKTFPAADIRAAYNAGLRDFGENKIQEAMAKQAELADLTDITWHFLGHIQTNKARKAIQHFEWIHSVDSLKLARRLDQIAAEQSRSPICCLQVKLLADPNKYGWTQTDLQQSLADLAQLSHIKLKGIMTIPPYGLLSSETQTVFEQAYALGQSIANHQETPLPIRYFSMGMSQDFPLAIAAGANIIRLGTTLFGARN
ncbi:YggS family pyridoxal phosphate-dependent enzyme [Leptolyngbya cf. ectocarpi LEGE 11479]|uniref:Pyridoxal phosphate homeostasis protein n=1 Tax=Leptolyngbya cf. ectocarpi LEGE 11479 TaxID=1828722 RepID=A0A928X4D6_LEPEC|nr:YggS family pyridoxal phosphate-dependent enzyme [Leptolyngbya ectocarpi]MBE9067171.1 YggS family pyridoxal phosphate-dependent enzyme [Leptolyngbya cf. ectocarpi LEGE 11479]